MCCRNGPATDNTGLGTVTLMRGEVKGEKLTLGRGPGREEVCGLRRRACEPDIGAYSAIRSEPHAKVLMIAIGEPDGKPACQGRTKTTSVGRSKNASVIHGFRE
jgi:hypothetical protein